MSRLPRHGCLAALGLCAALSLPIPVAAHPYSSSRVEMDWNAESARFEVAVQVLPEDLVAMVGSELGSPFRLDESAACDAEITRYLGRHFKLENSEGQAAHMVWVGKEVAFEATWLYFELSFDSPPQRLDGLLLRVDFGLEHADEHVTALRIRFGAQEQGLLFSSVLREARLASSTSTSSGRNQHVE